MGQALQTGDGAAAQKAYATLQQDIQKINFGGRRPSEVQPHVEELIRDLIQAQASNTATAAAGAGSDTASAPAPTPAPPPANNASTATPAASTPEIVINIDESGGSPASAPEIVLNLASQNSGGSSPYSFGSAPLSRTTSTPPLLRMARALPTRKSFSISVAPAQKSLLTLPTAAGTELHWLKSFST